MKDESGKEPASIAGRVLKDPGSATKKEIQILAATVLTQAPDKKPPAKIPATPVKAVAKPAVKPKR
jgi:hypothetical protein